MSYGRPSKEERDRWAELLGDEKRKARRIRVRITGIVVIAAAVVGGIFFVQNTGLKSSCPDESALKATWAKSASDVSQADRDIAITDTIDCVKMVGKTREEIQAVLGDWTSIKEYKPATKGGRAAFLVWSNGSRTDGVRVDFKSNGPARSAQEYRPED